MGSFKIDYIEIPLILRVNIPLVVVKPSVYAGPALSFKTKCNAEDTSSGLTLPCDDPVVDAALSGTDVSGIVGAGVGIGPVTLDVQYDFSFSNILEASTTTEVKNQTWTVRAAFGI